MVRLSETGAAGCETQVGETRCRQVATHHNCVGVDPEHELDLIIAQQIPHDGHLGVAAAERACRGGVKVKARLSAGLADKTRTTPDVSCSLTCRICSGARRCPRRERRNRASLPRQR